MGDLSKLKVAIGQPELASADSLRNERARDRMMERAVDTGADLLVMPGSLEDPRDVHLVVLNDSRLDVAGSAVRLEACGESYRIGLDPSDEGCDFAVLGDSSPWTIAPGKPLARPNVPCIVLRPVGMSNIGRKVLAYDGGSALYGASGEVLARLRDDFEEDLQLVRLTQAGEAAEPCADKVLECLVKTMRRFDEQVLPWKPSWIIGLSGGLDSSVVAALLALAFGPDRVVGFNLATRYNSDTTKANAAGLASALGVKLRNGSIQDVVQATGDALSAYGYPADALQGLVLENAQARVRGHLLSTFAAVEGGVVVNNGNRVEGALGYATLYGDAIGALAPIGDLTKVRLFDLARAINARLGVQAIPENLLPTVTDDGCTWQMPPSAELADGQFDPMKWFYHDWLIEWLLEADDADAAACEVLQGYLDNRLADTPAAKWVRFYGLDNPAAFVDDLDWIMRSMRNSAFKRIQSPPAIAIASPRSVSAPPERQAPFAPSGRYQQLASRIRSL